MSLRIHFIGLSETDSALLRRILDFASRQKRDYRSVPHAAEANLLISDFGTRGHEQARATLRDNPAHLLILGAGEELSHPTEHALARPLLVTRVMRELDRIAALIAAGAPPASPGARVAEAHGEYQPEPPSPRQPCTALIPVRRRVTALAVIHRYAWQSRLRKPPSPPAAAQPEAEPRKRAQAHETATPKSRYRALVVDDSLAIRKQLELELRDADIAADFAEDGETALEKAAGNHYDLIFLDIMMPGIDGYEVCRQLRAIPEWKKTPITMLSGKTSPLDEVQGVLAGCSTYLTKPIKHEDFQKLLARVTQWIDAVKQPEADTS
ncbi:MAG TPA: response regulator [Chromatiaceae bacterium]|nr:response regulator [Chromatiaceae bacterium]